MQKVISKMWRNLVTSASATALIVLVLLAGSFIAPKVAHATTRTITLSVGGGCYTLDDDNTVGGASTAAVTFSHADGSSAHDAGGAGWQNGDGFTYWRDICPGIGDVVIAISGGGGAINAISGQPTGWTAQWTILSWYKYGSACGGNVTHTTAQSLTWSQASWDSSKSTAEWSGFNKYTAPSGHTCDVQFDYTMTGTASDSFRASTTDVHYAQWPSSYLNCPFQDYSTDKHVLCTYNAVAASSQISHKVKLVAPYPYTTAQFVFLSVYEKDTNGFYIKLANPGGVTGWTFN